jgi:hypothetical protein
MSQEQRFDIPQELRQLAEENVERARQLYLQFRETIPERLGKTRARREPSLR